MELWMGAAAVVFAVIALLNWRFAKKSAGDTHGTSRWATPFELFRKGAFKSGGIRIGDIAGRKSVYYHGPHIITIGASGAGKGAAAIQPNLLERNFIFLIDPGGENSAIAAKHWRAQGYPFFCINPYEVHTAAPWELPVHGFNPLAFLDPASSDFLADTGALSDVLIQQHERETASSDHFRSNGLEVTKGFLVHIKTAEPEHRQNLGTLYEYLKLPRDEWLALLRRMQRNVAAGGIVAATANTLIRADDMAAEEAHGVLSTISSNLRFLDDPRIRAFLSRNEVDFSVLKGLGAGGHGAVISVILPLKYLSTQMMIQRLAVACAVNSLQTAPFAKSNVLMLIDEAASLGRIAELPNWLANLRKYNVNIWSVWQNLAQIKQLYGDGMDAILGNCDLKQFLSVKDEKTGKYAQELLGLMTVQTVSQDGSGRKTFGQTGRALQFADELSRLGSDRQVVLMDNLHPISLRKTAYFERPEFAGRYETNPFRVGKVSGQPGLRDALMALWGDVYGALVWWMAPSKLAALVYLLLALVAALKLQAVL